MSDPPSSTKGNHPETQTEKHTDDNRHLNPPERFSVAYNVLAVSGDLLALVLNVIFVWEKSHVLALAIAWFLVSIMVVKVLQITSTSMAIVCALAVAGVVTGFLVPKMKPPEPPVPQSLTNDIHRSQWQEWENTKAALEWNRHKNKFRLLCQMDWEKCASGSETRENAWLTVREPISTFIFCLIQRIRTRQHSA